MEDAPKRRGRKPKEEFVLSEKDEKILESVGESFSEERKDEWLKRRAQEDKEYKENNKVVGTFYKKEGNKLIQKIKKKNGGCYSYYVGNLKKNPNLLTEEVKKLLKE